MSRPFFALFVSPLLGVDFELVDFMEFAEQVFLLVVFPRFDDELTAL
tara:strand:- start:3226 stop:3366 length:141 start_codon:yes stop_codon:yes gene_type:complete